MLNSSRRTLEFYVTPTSVFPIHEKGSLFYNFKVCFLGSSSKVTELLSKSYA